MGDFKKKKNRGSNYSEKEKFLILDLVDVYKHFIDNKKTDSITSREKEQAWEKIALQVNAASGRVHRSASSVKACYENLKKTSRKACADEKVELFKTGGRSATLKKQSKLLERVISMAPNTMFPLHSRFDGDSGYNARKAAEKGDSTPKAIDEVNTPSHLAVASREEVEIIEVEVAGFDFSPEESEVDYSNQNDRSVGMLQTPSHPALQRRATHPLISSSTPPVENLRKGESLPSVDTKSNYNSSRRRPMIQNPPSSKPGLTETFVGLAEAKMELVSLQIEHSKHEMDRKNRHAEEEYLRRKQADEEETLQIKKQNQVKLEILEVELDIKKQILAQEKAKLHLLEYPGGQ